MLGLGLGLSDTAARYRTGGPVAPPGFIFLTDADGTFLTDADGYYLMEAI